MQCSIVRARKSRGGEAKFSQECATPLIGKQRTVHPAFADGLSFAPSAPTRRGAQAGQTRFWLPETYTPKHPGGQDPHVEGGARGRARQVTGVFAGT